MILKFNIKLFSQLVYAEELIDKHKSKSTIQIYNMHVILSQHKYKLPSEVAFQKKWTGY